MNSKKCPPLVSKLLTPQIIWYQTDINVTIRIMLCDVTDYFIRVKDNLLLFSTIFDDKNYYVILYLFGAVVPEKTFHKNLGREVKIILSKAHTGLDWLRLSISKIKDLKITLDLDFVERHKGKIKDIISINELRKKHELVNIKPAGSSTDEDDNSEDEIMDEIDEVIK